MPCGELFRSEGPGRFAVDLQHVAAGGEAAHREGLLIERFHEIRRLEDEGDQRVAAVEGHGEGFVGLGPGDGFADVQVGDAGVALADGFLARGVDLHVGDQRGRVPGFEQRLGHEQMAGGGGMDAVGDDLGGVGGVGGVGLFRASTTGVLRSARPRFCSAASCLRKSP